ncbi:CHC2 zinc finger domain-containing protein [Paludisphaera rhizosphaerae]|uniref:CHC2 zinc finger domain-containing protein n=1 Tax=Paludisphaera rhizosphaerae TaxID=2711216 RepID=UPI0013EB7B17|nr:CHC2 zinc finger domain-containing protein [Paludisphaera rhizosphaerae]
MRPDAPRPRHDPAEIRAKASLLELAREAVPNMRREGAEWCGLCPFHSEKTGSFRIHERKGVFKCHGCGAGGTVIDFVMKLDGKSFGEAMDYLAGRLGLTPATGPVRPLRRRVPPKDPAADDRRKAQNVETAFGIWRGCTSSDDTMAQLYLMGRAIDIAARGGMPARLGFAHLLKHAPSGKSFPAMVGLITGAGGKFLGVHRTFLAFDSPANHPRAAKALAARLGREPDRVVVKAPVDGAKTMLGRAMGGCVCLARPGPVLAIAEGIETALSVQQATGLPCWAALSLGNIGGVPVPDEVREVRLFADNDMRGPDKAERIIQAAARGYRDEGLGASVVRAPKGMDFNDLIMEDYE